MSIEYNHSNNLHTVTGASAALEVIFGDSTPVSILDVGCGTGTWLRAAMDAGVGDILGLDGVPPKDLVLLFPPEKYVQRDLRVSWSLGRRFDAVFCLEVAEHLEPEYASMLIGQLTSLSDLIYFSAACPGQTGQHHVNCQWPVYWQRLFNERGFSCSDRLRWQIWDDQRIEPWYRQNLFLAQRDSALAGREARIKSIVHPEVATLANRTAASNDFDTVRRQIELGRMSVFWNLILPARALLAKLKRRVES